MAKGRLVLAVIGERAEQGARANAGTCHGSCWRTPRASSRRGSSLTLGEEKRPGNEVAADLILPLQPVPRAGGFADCSFMLPLTTERLRLRHVTLADTALIVEMLNDPDFITYIGDKGVRDLAGAEKYLREGPLASYARHGFGLWAVTLPDGTPIGMCGLLQRAFLPHPDLGYAFLARHRGRGYAHEAAAAVLRHAREQLGLTTLHAITALRNPDSVKLLGRLGFDFVELMQQPGYAEPSRLFVWRAENRPSVPQKTQETTDITNSTDRRREASHPSDPCNPW